MTLKWMLRQDHYGQIVTLKSYLMNKKIKFWTFNHENKAYFQYLFDKEHWESVLREIDVNIMFDDFIIKVTHGCNVAFPKKKKKKM